LYFLPGANHAIHVVVPEPASGQIAASWFNIFTGETHEEPPSNWYPWKGYQSPWKGQSAVLILKAK
jgi:hypothetical protein